MSEPEASREFDVDRRQMGDDPPRPNHVADSIEEFLEKGVALAAELEAEEEE